MANNSMNQDFPPPPNDFTGFKVEDGGTNRSTIGIYPGEGYELLAGGFSAPTDPIQFIGSGGSEGEDLVLCDMTGYATPQLPAWQLLSGFPTNGLFLLQTQTTASLAYLNFTSLISSKYPVYFLNITCSGTDIHTGIVSIQFSTDNGATWLAGTNYLGGTNTCLHTSTSFTNQGAYTNGFVPVANGSANSLATHQLWIFGLIDPSQPSQDHPTIVGQGTLYDGYLGTLKKYFIAGTCTFDTTTPVNALRIYMVGTASFYGLEGSPPMM